MSIPVQPFAPIPDPKQPEILEDDDLPQDDEEDEDTDFDDDDDDENEIVEDPPSQ